MKIIDCQKIRMNMLTEAKLELTKIYAKTGKEPKLVIVQVGDDPASNSYIKNKLKTGKECGVDVEHIKLSEDTTYSDLEKIVVAACEDRNVTGCMVQLPLPEHLKKYEQRLLDIIPWKKDVDGLSTKSMERLWTNKECLTPCTAEGVMRLLPENLEGKIVALLGRSNLVGKPLIKMLLDRNATPVICHSKTGATSMRNILMESDIVISAIGKPKYLNYSNFYTPTCIPNGTIKCKTIIDVGINRDENGKLCGDVAINTFAYTDCAITPVPKGVGSLTTAQLMLNVVKAYDLQRDKIS